MAISRYSREELEEFKQIILEKRQRALGELSTLQQAVTDNETSSAESGVIKMDDSAEVAERETLSGLATRQHRFIKNLDNALQRIENGTYGICRVTGNLIKKERLRVVPHATLSLEAKNRRY